MMKISTLIVALSYPLSFQCRSAAFGLTKLTGLKHYSRSVCTGKTPTGTCKVRRDTILQQSYRPYSNMVLSKDDLVKSVLTTWVHKWVIGQGLCPWAAGVMSENKLDVVVVRAPYEEEHLEDIYEAILEAAVSVIGSSTPTETCLVALPAITDFETFLKLVEDIEEILEENELNSKIQLATFHPNYQFAGTEVADVTNYTNRSPYPVIQLLRVPQVTEAIERVSGKTDFVWKNNIKRMKLLGLEKVKMLHSEIIDQVSPGLSADASP